MQSTLLNIPKPSTDRSGWPWTEQSLPVYTPADGSRWPSMSIVTPSFNQGLYLEETIRSILLQCYPRAEFILIDGGSTDETTSIMERYKENFTFWVSEPDHGQSEAINKGFTKATGELVTFQNSDDIYLLGAFQRVASIWNSLQDKQDVGAIVGSFQFIDEYSNRISKEITPFVEGETPADFSTGIPYRLHQVATFYSRRALEAVGMSVREDLKYTMDRELLYRVATKFRIHIIPETLAAFRVHKASKSVAVVLPFVREFASLHRSFCDGNPESDALRRKAARQFIAKGYLKYARLEDQRTKASMGLCAALRYAPHLIWRKSYWGRWKAILIRRNHAGRS